MKKLIFLVALLVGSLEMYAQDFVDNALLFSRTRPAGSARIQALGGAQTALGGDYSSALSNPAGLGIFNRSEFTISPGLNFQRVESDYLGQSTNDSKSVFNIPGLSIVLNKPSGRESGFIGGSFGFSLSRTNDLNYNFRYSGTNDQNSIVDYFIGQAYGIDPDDMLYRNGRAGDQFYTLTGLAYNNFLIEDFVDDNGDFAYRSVLSPLPADPGFPAEVRTVDQEEINKGRGAQYQWSLSYGANFNDKLFLGAGVGLTTIRYRLEQSFRESNFRYSVDVDYNPIDNFVTNETYDISGAGVNATIGVIYRPISALQLGVSYVTPTSYSITDTYTARIDSRWNVFNVPDNPSFPDQQNVFEQFEDEPVISDYRLRSPSRLSGGLAYITKIGFITADVEMVNYSNAKYNSTSGNYNTENQSIKAQYQSVYNYRVGAEFRKDIYRARAGFNYMADPYKQSGINQSMASYSFGLGLRKQKFYVDFTTILNSTERNRIPYFVDGTDPVANQKFRNISTMLTFGFTF